MNDDIKGVLLALTLIILMAGVTYLFIYIPPVPADPCQPSREINYECMPGGDLNPIKGESL